MFAPKTELCRLDPPCSYTFSTVHLFLWIFDECLMYPQSVCGNTPPGWKHSYFHTPRINQPSPMRTLSLPLQILSTTVQSNYRLHQNFPWHGASFPRSTIHIHVNVARNPSHSSNPPLAASLLTCSRRGSIPTKLLPSCRSPKTSFPSLQQRVDSVDFHLSIDPGLVRSQRLLA